jgi:hypothetical protein
MADLAAFSTMSAAKAKIPCQAGEQGRRASKDGTLPSAKKQRFR